MGNNELETPLESQESEHSKPSLSNEPGLENAAPYGAEAPVSNEASADLAGGLSLDLSPDVSTDPSPDLSPDLSMEEERFIMASMEAILFMSDKPVSLPKLRAILNPNYSLPTYRRLMTTLRQEFAMEHRGVEIAEVALGFQLRTKPHMAQVLRKLVKTQPLKLSPTTMEVLAIVAFKQPITKEEVDQIRGVDSGYVLRNLMEKRLVKIAGRSELPGKPLIYATTHEFLELFNLKDIKQMPPLYEVEAMVAANEVGFDEKTRNVTEAIGKLLEQPSTPLFDDSSLDSEVESLRREIAHIPTTTAFIEEQKNRDKFKLRLLELRAQGLSLDADGNTVPLDSELAVTEANLDEALDRWVAASPPPSVQSTLQEEAEAATRERLTEQVESIVAEYQASVFSTETDQIFEIQTEVEHDATSANPTDQATETTTSNAKNTAGNDSERPETEIREEETPLEI